MRTEIVTVCLLAIASQTMMVSGAEGRLHLRRTEEQAVLDKEELSLWGRLLQEDSSMCMDTAMSIKGKKKTKRSEEGGYRTRKRLLNVA